MSYILTTTIFFYTYKTVFHGENRFSCFDKIYTWDSASAKDQQSELFYFRCHSIAHLSMPFQELVSVAIAAEVKLRFAIVVVRFCLAEFLATNLVYRLGSEIAG